QMASVRAAGSGGMGSGASIGLGAFGLGQLPAAATALATIGAEIQTLGQSALLLPGIFAGATAAVGTLVVGMQNLGDSFSDDPEKAAEAMDKLADSARETVTVIRSFGDEWGRVQRSVQQELFEGTAEPVRRAIDNILPSLETGMTGVASRLGEGAQLAADELSNQWSRGGLERLFRNVEGAIGDLNPAIQPLMASFRTIAVTGSNFLPGMARGFAGLATDFGEFIGHADRAG